MKYFLKHVHLGFRKGSGTGDGKLAGKVSLLLLVLLDQGFHLKKYYHFTNNTIHYDIHFIVLSYPRISHICEEGFVVEGDPVSANLTSSHPKVFNDPSLRCSILNQIINATRQKQSIESEKRQNVQLVCRFMGMCACH